MADPFVVPAGVTIAALIIGALGWYGMLRTGIQFVHDDLHARKSYGDDIMEMLSEVNMYQAKLVRWKKEWHISEYTDDELLKRLWGNEGANDIKIQWNAINGLLDGIQNDLKSFTMKRGTKKGTHFMKLTQTEWTNLPDEKKRKKVKYIWTKKTYLKTKVAKFPGILNIIDEASKGAWLDQQELHGFSNPYHTQKIYHFKRIAKELGKDFDKLCDNLHVLQHLVVALDLDIFNAFSASSLDVESATVAALAATEHLKLDLLFGKRPPPKDPGQASFTIMTPTRAHVEKAIEPPAIHGSPSNAFKAIMNSPGPLTCYFGTQTKFSLSKAATASNPGETFKERFSKVLPPVYDSHRNRFDPSVSGLGDVSTFRLCHELSQACILLLRTGIFAGICGCQLLCGSLRHGRHDAPRLWYEYGMLLGCDSNSHQRPSWRDPRFAYQRAIQGDVAADSWCLYDNTYWDAFTQPIRRIGLLFLEIILGTNITRVSISQKGAVTYIQLVTRLLPDRTMTRMRLSMSDTLELVANTLRNSDARLSDDEINSVRKAVNVCLTDPFDPIRTEDQWNRTLDRLYRDVVEPMRDVYTRLHRDDRLGVQNTP